MVCGSSMCMVYGGLCINGAVVVYTFFGIVHAVHMCMVWSDCMFVTLMLFIFTG